MDPLRKTHACCYRLKKIYRPQMLLTVHMVHIGGPYHGHPPARRPHGTRRPHLGRISMLRAIHYGPETITNISLRYT